MTVRTLLATTAAAALTAASLVVLSPTAQADDVWYQAYARSTSSAPCPAPPGQTPWQASYGGQAAWTASWAQWPNGGTGGWVCQRSIVWGGPGAGPNAGVGVGSGVGTVCIPVASLNQWFAFPTDGYLPAGSPAFSNSSCLLQVGTSTQPMAAAGNAATAAGRCDLMGETLGASLGPDVWACNPV